jgi:16S rRNA (cytosine967-C5)-methyltransferase
MSAVWTIAIEALSWMELEGLGLASALTQTTSQLEIRDPRLAASARRLIRECLRRRNFIDAIVNHAVAPEALSAFSLGVQAFLRLYTYQTKFTAAGREVGVQLAVIGRQVLGWKTVMPVEEALGRILAMDPRSLLDAGDEIERISLRTFQPTWFTKYCIRLLGRQDALQLLTTPEDVGRPLLCVNIFKADEAAVLSTLATQGVTVEPVDALPFVYRLLETTTPLTRLKAFRDGWMFLPNPASCIAVVAGKPTADATVLDVGTTHGGKAAYAALFLQGSGRVLSLDYPSRRMGRVQAQLKRLGISNVDVAAADLEGALPVTATADVIYVSPPSSGSGAFWRTASKWRGSAVVTRMIERQWKLLTQCIKYLAPRGCLIYSTSSLLVEENELIIERFLLEYPEFVLAEVEPRLGDPGLRGQSEALRLYPHRHHVDGTFIAKLVRGVDF